MQERQLKSWAEAHGATLAPFDLAMHETVEQGESASTGGRRIAGMNVTRRECSATTTLTAAGRTTIKLSATAPTCTVAISMVGNGIKTYLVSQTDK